METKSKFLDIAFAFARHPGFLVAKKIKRVADTAGIDTVEILDVGSGEGRPWGIANKYIDPNLKIKLTVIDAFKSKDHAAEQRPATLVTRKEGQIIEFLKSEPSDSKDVVFMLDVIEHLSKENGYLALYEMNRISRFGTAITTPNGFVWQPPTEENPFQAHVSGWTAGELRKAGMKKVLGLHGLSWLTGSYGAKKYPLIPIFYPLYGLETLLGRFLKRCAAHLWAENNSGPQAKSAKFDSITDKLSGEF